MGRPSRLILRWFAASAVVWAVALPGAAMLASRPAPDPLRYLLATAVYAAGSVVCHQRPERSFQLWGRQLPVCARCTGIYVGAAAAVLLIAAIRLIGARPGGRLDSRVPKIERAPLTLPGAVLVGCILNAVTLIFEWTTGVMPANTVRAAAGFALGAAVCALVLVRPIQSDEVN